jgi:mevalonate pyrophosphate decarboxylase
VFWVPETPRINAFVEGQNHSLLVPELKGKDVDRMVCHVDRIKRLIPALFQKFGLTVDPDRGRSKKWIIRSANSFPSSSGIASSASSFAALTLASAAALARDFNAFENLWKHHPEFRRALSGLSRQGSGSSCRSFEGPWVFWEGERTSTVPSGLPPLAHFVILIERGEKAVASSEAHLTVRTSPLWNENSTSTDPNDTNVGKFKGRPIIPLIAISVERSLGNAQSIPYLF